MRARITSRRLLIAAVIAVAIIFIGIELYFLSATVRLGVVGCAENLGADEYLAGRLADRDLGVRTKAAEALVRRGNRAVPALVGLLHDPEPGNRRIAATALAKIGSGALEAFPALLKVAIEDPDEGVLETSGQALGKIAHDHPERVLELLAMLDSPVDADRLAAIRSTAWLDDARAVPSLLASLKHSNPKVREEAAESLGELKGLSIAAVPTLLMLLDDPSPEVRSEASQAIAKIIRAAPDKLDPALLVRAKQAIEHAIVKPKPAISQDDD